MRALIKDAAARAISWSGIASVARANPFVVYYHRVVEKFDATGGVALPAMEITAGMLERHLDWLGRNYEIVSLDALETPSSRPRAVVTFDDGYSDIYHHAFPLLKRKGIPAAIFVVTDLVGTSTLPIHEELHGLLVSASRQGLLSQKDPFVETRRLLNHFPQSEVRRVIDSLKASATIDEPVRRALQPLTWEMLAEMRDAGMTIGSHSTSHAFLTNEPAERVIEEVRNSRRELQEKLGIDAKYFAYPGGDFNSDVVQAVADAGYTHAFSICRHIDPQHPTLTIPRRGLWEKSCVDSHGQFSPAIMHCQTTAAFDWISKCTQPHGALAQ